jgi:hypothetical protein
MSSGPKERVEKNIPTVQTGPYGLTYIGQTNERSDSNHKRLSVTDNLEIDSVLKNWNMEFLSTVILKVIFLGSFLRVFYIDIFMSQMTYTSCIPLKIKPV